MGSPGARSGRARRSGLASRHRPVPRRRPLARRPCPSGRGCHLLPHHRLLRLAVEDRRRAASACDCPCPPPSRPTTGRLFLNVTLPSGIAGDVHRGVRHGRDADDVGRGMRAVVWERTAGQVVQVILTIAVLLVLPSPVRSIDAASRPARSPRWVAVMLGAGLRSRRAFTAGSGCGTQWRPTSVAGSAPERACPAVVLASAVVVLGHAATFLIAARTAGRHRAAVAGCCRSRCSRCWPWRCRASPAGGRARASTAWVFAAAGLGREPWRRDRRGLRRHGARREPARGRSCSSRSGSPAAHVGASDEGRPGRRGTEEVG